MPGHLLWAEIWHVLGPMFEEVMREDKPVWHDDLLLTLKRCGASETTYWSFCYSGIHDQAGKVLGIFSPAVETTTRVLNARRMRTLGDLGVRTPYSRSLEEVHTYSSLLFLLRFIFISFSCDTGMSVHDNNTDG